MYWTIVLIYLIGLLFLWFSLLGTSVDKFCIKLTGFIVLSVILFFVSLLFKYEVPEDNYKEFITLEYHSSLDLTDFDKITIMNNNINIQLKNNKMLIINKNFSEIIKVDNKKEMRIEYYKMKLKPVFDEYLFSIPKKFPEFYTKIYVMDF